MSLNELDTISEDNTRLKSIVDGIKNYIQKTRLVQNDIINIDHLFSFTKIPKPQLVSVLNKGIAHGLLQPIYMYYCDDTRIIESESEIHPFEDFCDQCCEIHEFTEEYMRIGYKITFETNLEPIIDIDEVANIGKYTIGIITALPHELTAFKAMLSDIKEIRVKGRGAGRRYFLGEIASRSQIRHYIILAPADVGNNIAAARATLLLEHFPNIESIIMVGIAGGVPNPDKVEEHVRLGDIVVSDHRGVVQYDFGTETISEFIFKSPPRPPSASLLEAVKLLKSSEMEGYQPWVTHVNDTLENLDIYRPPDETDVLASSENQEIEIPHPEDHERISGQPRIFTGPIAASNIILKNPIKRDELRDKFNVKAVEMESSGIADATWYHEIEYLVVRGICDYCDGNKGNSWQEYAAIVAAAYTRSLLESM